MYKNTTEDTIVAISTPIGEGGIGIVRLSGPKALDIADKVFKPKDDEKPSEFKTHTVHYGHIVEKGQGPRAKGQGGVIDEVILTVMKAPKTYTKEDIVEINCHGGIQATKRVLGLTIRCGARIAEPGEFTKRAFLNGRIDLAQAEAVLDIVAAKTDASLKVAISQLEGDLSKRVNRIRQEVIDVASHVEASIDFPDEELDIINEEAVAEKTKDIISQLKELVDSFDDGIVLREGILAIICGKPNVGKSSLMNLLLKRDRVIVSHVPGTTRDAVEELINLKGVPVRLVDTAGIVETNDIVEREGVRRSKKYVELADIAIFMLDASSKLSNEDWDISKLLKDKKKIIIINKIDIPQKIDMKKIKEKFRGSRIVEISVEKKNNIAALEKTILETVWSGDFYQGEGAMVSNVRHKELLDNALKNMLSVDKVLSDFGKKEAGAPELIAIDLKDAIFNLGLIIGKSVSGDVLDRIFEQFCIGK